MAKTPRWSSTPGRSSSGRSGSEMPGAGSFEPNRNKTMMAPVNSSFLRRSGVRNARANIASLATDP